MDKLFHIISLGAGVQSSTMALMAAHGEIGPMPDAAIFADTQAEPASVYRWLDWLELQLPFPVYRVTAGDLARHALDLRTTKDGRLYSKTNVPFFTKAIEDGSRGKIRFRSCTADFKIAPIRKKSKELAGIKRGQKTVAIIQWIGISRDEATRMKPSRDAWVEHRWPLIEMGITRAGCLAWMESKGYPTPPRSSCVFCPFHNNSEWRRLRDEEPEEFKRAADFEYELQMGKAASTNFRTVPFLHKSCVPLEAVDLSTEKERGQANLFENECEGMCGV